MEALFPRSTPHHNSDRSRASMPSPKQASVNSRIWKWLSILQGYNVDIQHIPGKRNPADSLSRQSVVDALVKKSLVHDANAAYVQ